MEIRNVEYYPADFEGDNTLNTFVLRMQTNEAIIQLQCKEKPTYQRGCTNCS